MGRTIVKVQSPATSGSYRDVYIVNETFNTYEYIMTSFNTTTTRCSFYKGSTFIRHASNDVYYNIKDDLGITTEALTLRVTSLSDGNYGIGDFYLCVSPS